MTLRLIDTQNKSRYAGCHVLFIVILIIIMLSVVMLNVILLSVVMLNVNMLNDICWCRSARKMIEFLPRIKPNLIVTFGISVSWYLVSAD